MDKILGINLGGWLVIERWMTPQLFGSSTASDEYSLCYELGVKKAQKRLHSHRSSFITKKDFQRIKKSGLNALRIPVGYWNFEEDPPFISALEFLDLAMDWAGEFNLKVLIDLHGAPGSQNGWDHSGRSGEMNWNKSNENIERTLFVLEKIAQRYGEDPALWGIELLNEPSYDIPLGTLQDFYLKGYDIIRANAPESVNVIMHDSFRPESWLGFFQKHQLTNVILDCHLYQCFSDYDKKLDVAGHLQKTLVEWQKMINKLQQFVPVLIGEWSFALDQGSLQNLSPTQVDRAIKTYAQTQLMVFETAAGWFFWTYKLHNREMKKTWSFDALTKEYKLK